MHFLDLKLNILKRRRVVHVLLLILLIILLSLLFLLLFNELYNENRLKTIKSDLNKTYSLQKKQLVIRDDYRIIHDNLRAYLNTNDKSHLENYYNSLDTLSNHINFFYETIKSDQLFLPIINYKDLKFNEIERNKFLLDSLVLKQKYNDKVINFKDLNYKNFNYKDVLNSVKIESYIIVDSLEKKGLFSRLGDAILGKVDVQKEKLNITVTMKYGKEITTGNIEQQLENAFKKANHYYSNEFGQIKGKLNKSENFIDNNYAILMHSDFILNSINKALLVLDATNEEKFNKQNITNNTIRRSIIFGLLFLLLIISGILIILTYLAFNYENRLIDSQLKLNENLQFKNRIVGMISHEIRSPLNIISMYLKSVLQHVKDESLKSTLNSIQFTTSSLSLMTNQILEFSKNQNKRLELNKENFNLKSNINEIIKGLNSLVESNNNQLVYENNIHENTIVNSDKIKLQQLLYNLVGNANKFTSNGKIKVESYIVFEYVNKIKMLLVVEDNGEGISSEDLEHVFDNYYQGTLSSKVNNLGVGLGLNLCKEIVQLFDGEIKISSQLNVGTKVECEMYFELI